MPARTYHHQKEAIIPAPQAEVFAYLDDQTRLAAHMEKRSMMMLGGRMTYAFDAGQGRAVGSVIRMGGHFLGLSLVVVEVVTERTPPASKTWARPENPSPIPTRSCTGWRFVPRAGWPSS